MNMNESKNTRALTVKDFVPLLVIFIVIGALTLAGQLYRGLNISNAMSDFMGFI